MSSLDDVVKTEEPKVIFTILPKNDTYQPNSEVKKPTAYKHLDIYIACYGSDAWLG